MSTDVEQHTEHDVTLAEQNVTFEEEHGSEDLLRFARDLQLAYNFSRSLVTTPFVPQQYQGNPGHAAAAIMTARGVGITDPMAALRALDIIQGTPAFRANTLRALVQRDGHRLWVVEANSQRVIMRGQRRGDDQVQESMWDMDRARAMGLTNKDNWKKQPQAMLTARATSELARLIAADSISGLYSVEELTDGVVPAESAPAVESKPAPKRRMSRRKVEPVPVAPEVSADPTDYDEDLEPEKVAAAQAKRDAVVPAPVDELTVETSVPGEGDPLKPTPEEAAEWGLMPDGFES